MSWRVLGGPAWNRTRGLSLIRTALSPTELLARRRARARRRVVGKERSAKGRGALDGPARGPLWCAGAPPAARGWVPPSARAMPRARSTWDAGPCPRIPLAGARGRGGLPRKEVIQPHLPV